MLLFNRTRIHKRLFNSAAITLCLLLNVYNNYAQVGISGPTSVSQNTSYTYYPTYNGSSTYSYSGWYTWSISGGYETSTGNTYKSGTCYSVLYSIGINITWNSSSGSLTFGSSLGNNTIYITAVPPLNAGSLSPTSQTINYGATPGTITGTAASGGASSPSYSYQWQSSSDAVNWSNISGTTSLNYSPGNLYSTTYYRRKVTENTTSSVAYTSTATVTVYPQLTCTISPASQNITAGTSAATLTSSVSGGNGSYTYQWQSSPDNSAWTNVGTASSYSPGVLFSAMYYRLTVTSNGANVTSNTATVTICTAPAGPIIGLSTCVLGSTIQLADGTPGGSWSSSNAGIAKVDVNGVVTGMAAASATITYTVTNSCGTTSAQLGITVVPFSSLLDSLGSGITDPIITDTISLVQNTVKVTQFQQDTLYSSAHSIKNVIALRVVEETNKYIPGDFSATVVVKIEYGHSANDIYQVDSTKLTVTYTKNAGNKYNAINYLTFNNAEYIRITVVRVDAPTTVNSVSFDTKQVLLLTNSLMATRYYKLADNKKPVLTYTNPSGGIVPDALAVNWVHPAHANNNYTQLEWTWLEDEMSNAYMNGSVFDTTLLFKNNGTRIDLPGGAVAGGYNIPLLYGGVGKLFMRVRGVNIMRSGSRSDGPWSGVQTFSFNGHNDSLNWQATTTYAEEGKRKTVIQYYDGSLRARQTVTKDNTTQTTVVAETFYDGQGRPAVQILPAPGISNIIAYVKNLNKFNGQPDNINPADYFDFTTASLGNYATTPMDSARGTHLYYSRNNAEWNSSYNKNMPAANGFAYSVTRYTPDATGRIMMQSGVGDSMQMGGNHTTKYFYGTAAKEELDALFGTEVGNYTHYFKNMVQDANGQMSVSYVDMHGRTIATALAGESPATLQALNITDTSQYKNQAGKVLTRNLLDNSTNTLKGNSIESINTLLVPFKTNYAFNYALTKQTLTLPKCSGDSVSYDCKFDLQISISNESGDSIPIVYNYPGIANINFQQSLLLPAGSYSVRKTLTINADSLDKFVQQYNTVGIGLCQTLQYLTDSIAAQDSTASGCSIPPTPLTSSSCLTSLGTYSTYLSNYATSLGYSVGQLSAAQVNDIRNQYINDSTLCASLNTNTSRSLENIRRQMLSDMVPYSGQYARDTGTVSMALKYNIFSSSGNPNYSQPFYKYPRNQSLAIDNYYDPFANIDSSVLSSRLSTMSAADFESEFKDSWTKSLLPYHPEFKKLKFAEDSLRPSFNFIDSIQLVTTAFDPIAGDPFFAIPSRSSDKDSITKYSNVAWAAMNNYTMWQIAYGDAFGCKATIDTAIRRTCYNNMPKQLTATGTVVNNGSGNVTLSTAIQSQAWTMYKGFYGQIRGDMVNRYINVRPGTTDTTDNRTLINQQFRIYFPYNYVQQAQNAGWTSWYPSQSGTLPPVSLNDSVKLYSNRCDSYIGGWRVTLLQCPTLATAVPDSATRENVVASITARMAGICKLGTDAANPYGSSTVPTAYLSGSDSSFERVVNKVFDSLSIPRSLYCNPYVIEWPKPYGKNPLISKQYVAGLDTCNCSQWSKLRTEITNAGYNSNSLTSINQYLWNTYQDTITQVLYDGLTKCGQYYLYRCRDTSSTCYNHGIPYSCTITICDTLYTLPLASVQPLPAFLICGFNSSQFGCFTCSNFKSFDTTFNTIFAKHPVLTGTISNDTTIAYNDLFAKYVNFKTGLQYNWQYYADKFNTTSCGIGGITGSGAGLSICLDKKPLNDTTGLIAPVSPCQQVRNNATVKAAILYEYNQQQAIANFKAAYLAKCVSAAETFTVADTIKEYHYTLYYYDEAGNLVKTAPPKGVNPIYRQTWIDSVEIFKQNGWQLTPQHSLVTRYCYNSLNQVNIQKSPDGGSSKFWYDRLGRLTISQNAKQNGGGNVYSYTFYDSLGRITQVGQITGGSVMTDATAKNDASLQSWFASATNTRNQVTQTVYDTAYAPISGLYLTQQNLRNRVSYSQVINNAADPYPAGGTFYSYDIHGNVDTLLQDFGNSGGIRNAMNANNNGTLSGNRFKRIVYNYDLISGKVNQVSYQPGDSDAYYHRYAYDAENRITDVYTGRDSVMLFLFPEREAHYYYYKHGPLARTDLGQLRVQGLDYAYTMQGWLKAVNPVMGGTLTNGTDTTEPYPVAQDVYGFSLNYYKGDYKAIGYSPQPTSVIGALGTNAAPLYNGNIAAMVVNIPKFGATKVYDYHYDQLNRIVAMDMYNGLIPASGTFTAVNDTSYKERISYDPNGNILSYWRNGDLARPVMDRLSYFYKVNTNQLHKVTDAAADAAPADYSKYNDIKQGQADNNYQYDAIGNLVVDASEGITNISWSVYGKILSITKSGAVIRYVYDAGGNRIMKQTTTDTTVYVRDASGNVMSVYVKPAGGSIAQTEMHIYGSSRLGMATKHLVTDTTFNLSGGFGTITGCIFTRGEKLFELSNHLGNVLVTISDRRIQNSAGGTTVDYYAADMITANDYFPFGMLQPGRKYSAPGSYRYGFNGKEKDNDVKGEGNSLDFGARIYDPRTGRFLSTDALTKAYPSQTPYDFAGNNPILLIDVEGNGPDLPPAYVLGPLLTNHPLGTYALIMSNNTSPNQLYKWVNKTSSDPMAYYKLKGAFGEAEAFKRLFTDFYLGSEGIGIPAFNTTIGARHNGLQVDIQTKISSYTQRGGLWNTRHTVGIRNYSFEGKEKDLEVYGREKDATYTINYEVKTLSPTNDVGFNFRKLAEGIQQTIARAKGQDVIGVLVTDKQTWLNVANDAVYGPQLRALYEEMTQVGNGAYLRLEENLNKDANNELMSARKTVQEAIDKKAKDDAAKSESEKKKGG
jgi:RHS repeat-associated protein